MAELKAFGHELIDLIKTDEVQKDFLYVNLFFLSLVGLVLGLILVAIGIPFGVYYLIDPSYFSIFADWVIYTVRTYWQSFLLFLICFEFVIFATVLYLNNLIVKSIEK